MQEAIYLQRLDAFIERFRIAIVGDHADDEAIFVSSSNDSAVYTSQDRMDLSHRGPISIVDIAHVGRMLSGIANLEHLCPRCEQAITSGWCHRCREQRQLDTTGPSVAGATPPRFGSGRPLQSWRHPFPPPMHSPIQIRKEDVPVRAPLAHMIEEALGLDPMRDNAGHDV